MLRDCLFVRCRCWLSLVFDVAVVVLVIGCCCFGFVGSWSLLVVDCCLLVVGCVIVEVVGSCWWLCFFVDFDGRCSLSVVSCALALFVVVVGCCWVLL